ncbi:hypothetical protein KJ641_04270 [Patescibacteria group bacterium]|nr:hypothetical protein [Patescibacteria group bacterium]
MKKYFLGIGVFAIALMLVGGGCASNDDVMDTSDSSDDAVVEEATTLDTDTAVVEDTSVVDETAVVEESVTVDTRSDSEIPEDVDPIDLAIESGDPAECEKLENPAVVQGCLREQGN